MNFKNVKYELQNILSGKSGSSKDATIQTIANYLRDGQKTSPVAQGELKYKKQEAKKLIEFSKRYDFFIEDIDESQYLSSGAEQKVYIENTKNVFKLNDAIYYTSWLDYFYNLLLNNYFFSDTAYDLIGFHIIDETLHAVVNQNYIRADEITNLSYVNKFMQSNGFENTRNNDYYNPKLGIILDDLHDENVLTSNGLLYFIDTVFYINPDIFWKNDD